MLSADLTLPGEIPGLLRRGSPVVCVPGHLRDEPPGAPGVVIEVLPRDAEAPPGVAPNLVVAFRWASDPTDVESEQICEATSWDLSLDLADPTGGAHAAWWALPLHVSRSRLVYEAGDDTAEARRAHALLLDAAMGREVDLAELRRVCLALWEAL